jgi:hypothetical protein
MQTHISLNKKIGCAAREYLKTVFMEAITCVIQGIRDLILKYVVIHYMLKDKNRGITLICPAEPYSSVPLDLLKLQGGLCSSDGWNRMASIPV